MDTELCRLIGIYTIAHACLSQIMGVNTVFLISHQVHDLVMHSFMSFYCLYMMNIEKKYISEEMTDHPNESQYGLQKIVRTERFH